MMKDKCVSCKFRYDPEIGGCAHSPDKANPVRGNLTDDCIFLRTEGLSRWQQKIITHGKIISPMESPNPAPMNPEIRSGPPEDTGYSLVCRQSPSKLGAVQFYLKDGLCYSADEEKRYLGTIEEMTPREPSEAELQEGVRWLKEKFHIT